MVAAAIARRSAVNTAICLAGYGMLVAAAAPRAFSMSVTGRAPRLGIAGWFIAIATVLLSWILALIKVGSSPASAPLRAGALLLLAVFVLRMTWAILTGGARARVHRRRQRNWLAVLGRRDGDLDVLLVESPAVMVYCLPGRPATVVVTSGAREALTPQQLNAVLAHERAHISGRHSIVLAAAYAMANTLPWINLFRTAADHVSTLLEMRADDIAARRHGRGPVASALASMNRSPAPAPALGAAGPTVVARAQRLSESEPMIRRRYKQLALAGIVAAFAAGPYLAAIGPICPHSLW